MGISGISKVSTCSNCVLSKGVIFQDRDKSKMKSSDFCQMQTDHVIRGPISGA